MRSIYANPYKYAVTCDIPFELAKIACAKARHCKKEARKHPMRCPNCNSKRLCFEHGSYEEGYSDYIECDNCGETYDVDAVPNSEYQSLTGYEDFDAVLFYSGTEDGYGDIMPKGAAKTHEEWVKFARDAIIGKRNQKA